MFGLDMNLVKMILVSFATLHYIDSYNDQQAIDLAEEFVKRMFKRYGIDWD